MMNKLNAKELYCNISNIDKQISKLNNDRYSLNEQYVKQLYEECQLNVGKCFVNKLSSNKTIYYMIISTEEITYQMRLGSSFNQHKYNAMTFEYPYNNSKLPFIEDDIQLDSLLKNEFLVSIDKKIFKEKFNEVNESWIKNFNY